MQWLSRTLAILIFMVGPGLLGSYLDNQFGTGFLTPVGFALGIFIATTALVALAHKLTPPARGKPIPFDDESEQDTGSHPST